MHLLFVCLTSVVQQYILGQYAKALLMSRVCLLGYGIMFVELLIEDNLLSCQICHNPYEIKFRDII